jgi:outer membrane protein assembly factor BamB
MVTISGITRAWLAAGLAVACLGLSLEAQDRPRRVPLGDWPEMRGPNRNGVSPETGLPERWAVDGENFLWRAPYGGRSSPIVVGNRVCVQNPSGRGAQLQERVMCLDADTGKVLWEHKFNIFQSDVPPHRVGWASPAGDPETGNVYALGGGAYVIALSRDGKVLWERSIGEEFAAFTTHGGRTASPLIDGDLVIVSAAVSNWGAFGARQHRFIALDKRTGEIVYVASPGGRPYDTNYSAPLVATINGMRLLISGSGDGAVHAMKPQTGEKVWSYVAAKRAINTGVVVSGTSVIVSHGDENLDTSQMGLIAAIDGSQTGDIKTTKWAVKGTEFGFSSPVIDGQRIYQLDNGAVLHGYELETGRLLFEHSIGQGQKAPLVFADGKFYVGTENGRFFILRPRVDRVDVLSDVLLPISKDSVGGSEGTPEQIVSGAAVSRGRVYFVSSDAVYAFGPKTAAKLSGYAVDEPAQKGEGEPAFVQVSPTELTLKPGQTVKLRVRLFDAKGRFLRDGTGASWSLQGLKGSVTPDGAFTAPNEPMDQAGTIRATVGSLSGEARARIVRPIPWTETFDAYPDGAQPPGWISMATGKFAVATVDGQKVLQKPADNTLFKRIRMFAGGLDESNYTVEADVRTPTRRRQQGDVGVTAQRYSLILYGNSQRLKIEPWEPETARTASVAFAWKPDTWYHLKLEVQNMPDGSVRARGKAWPTGEAEPPAWTIEKVDPIGNRKGSAGMFIDAEFGASIDNYTVTANR